MRVVDIYDRYQDITNVAAFAAATDAVYLKGSDGGAPGPVRADAFAKIMRDTNTPFGLYHYAQFSPSPEAQARVLAAEVRRLGATGLPPALDLEAPFLPNQTARDFAIRFLNELRNQGFADVTLYANTSMLTGIRAWTLGVPGLRIWAATYGNNDSDFDEDDRARLRRQYPHEVWLYQYSSTGRVAGIPQNTDLNMYMTTEGAGDMTVSQQDADLIAQAVWDKQFQNWETGDLNKAWVLLQGTNIASWRAADKPAGDVDEAALATALAEKMLPPLQETLREEDGFNEEDADRLVRKMGEKMAAQIAAEVRATPTG